MYGIEVMERHPILLNRAPTLHRLLSNPFLLVEDRAIYLYPEVQKMKSLVYTFEALT